MDASLPENSTPVNDRSRPPLLAAHVAPFVVFMLMLGLADGVSKVAGDLAGGPGAFWLVEPEFWIYPLQTAVCGWLLLHFRRRYDFHRWTGSATAVATGFLALAIWLAPQFLPGAERRIYGFDPTVFAGNPAAYWTTILLRFLRLVIVVPFLEEIFWRGFLLRYLISEKFEEVPFGTFSWKSFLLVAGLFGLAHAGPDFWVAIATSLLYNGLAVATRSLGACIVAHAVTNLALGFYIMHTRQWGFW